jgi:hypothetical protein
MDRPDWTSRATAVDAVRVDVGFLVSETFYYGPGHGWSPEQWQQLREPLYQPQIERYGQYVLSAVLEKSAAELIRYYQDALRLIARHRKLPGQQLGYFWMRPLLFAPGDFYIDFPWYDTWEEAVPVLEALASPNDGLLFQDMDEGWEFQAFAEGDRLFLRQSDFPSGEDYSVVAADRATVAGQVPAVRQRVGRVLGELVAAVGRDYWSRRVLDHRLTERTEAQKVPG